MKKALAIAGIMVKASLRERSALLYMVILPLVFTAVVGVVFSSSISGGRGLPAIVVDLDGTEYSSSVIRALMDNKGIRAFPGSIKVYDGTGKLIESHVYLSLTPAASSPEATALAEEEIRSSTVLCAIVIPKGFGDSVKDMAPLPVVLTFPDRATEKGVISQVVSGAIMQVRAKAASAALAMDRLGQDSNWDAAYGRAEQAWKDTPAVTVTPVLVKREQKAQERAIDLASMGFLVTFAMMTVVIGAGEILQEKRMGTWGRLITTPTQKGSILGGKLLGLVALGWVQCGILLIAGQFVFKVNWGRDPVLVALALSCLVIAATGIGLLVAGFVKTQSQVAVFANLVILPSSMLAGVYWPFEIMPRSMQIIAQAFPQRHAMAALTDIIVRGSGLTAGVIMSMAILLAIGIVSLTLGLSRVRYE